LGGAAEQTYCQIYCQKRGGEGIQGDGELQVFSNLLISIGAYVGSNPTLSAIRKQRNWQLNCDQAARCFEERMQKAVGKQVGSSLLYSDYREWATEQGVGRLLTQKNLVQRLVNRHGLSVGRDMTHRYLEGAEFRSSADNVLAFRERESRQ
jgi:hypothetical protein